jgi:hypothetical protein
MRLMMINGVMSIKRGSIHPTYEKTILKKSSRSNRKPPDSKKREDSRPKLEIITPGMVREDTPKKNLSPLSNIHKSSGQLFKI